MSDLSSQVCKDVNRVVRIESYKGKRFEKKDVTLDEC